VVRERDRSGGVYMLHTVSFPAATQMVMPIRMTAATALFIASDFEPPSDIFATYTISIASVGGDKSKGLTDLLITPSASA